MKFARRELPDVGLDMGFFRSWSSTFDKLPGIDYCTMDEYFFEDDISGCRKIFRKFNFKNDQANNYFLLVCFQVKWFYRINNAFCNKLISVVNKDINVCDKK